MRTRKKGGKAWPALALIMLASYCMLAAIGRLGRAQAACPMPNPAIAGPATARTG